MPDALPCYWILSEENTTNKSKKFNFVTIVSSSNMKEILRSVGSKPCKAFPVYSLAIKYQRNFNQMPLRLVLNVRMSKNISLSLYDPQWLQTQIIHSNHIQIVFSGVAFESWVPVLFKTAPDNWFA